MHFGCDHRVEENNDAFALHYKPKMRQLFYEIVRDCLLDAYTFLPEEMKSDRPQAKETEQIQ